MKVETVYIADNIYGEEYNHCCVFVDGILEYSQGDYYHDKGDVKCNGYVACIRNKFDNAICKELIIVVNENDWLSDEEIQKLYDEHSLVG